VDRRDRRKVSKPSPESPDQEIVIGNCSKDDTKRAGTTSLRAALTINICNALLLTMLAIDYRFCEAQKRLYRQR
jgi:hypothetical protein